MRDLIDCGGRFLNGCELLLHACRLFLRGCANFRCGGVQVFRRFAALHCQLSKSIDHAVQRRAEAAQLVRSSRRCLSGEIAATDAFDEFHERVERFGDRRAQHVGDENTEDGHDSERKDDRCAALIRDVADAALANRDRIIQDIVGFLERSTPGIAAGSKRILGCRESPQDRLPPQH